MKKKKKKKKTKKKEKKYYEEKEEEEEEEEEEYLPLFTGVKVRGSPGIVEHAYGGGLSRTRGNMQPTAKPSCPDRPCNRHV